MKKRLLLCFISILTISFSGEINGQITSSEAWINEFHYDNDGSDIDEFVEIVIENTESYVLSDFEIYHYNGSNGEIIKSESVDELTEGESIGDFTFYTWYSSLQNGDDGIALVYQGSVIQFLSYEGSFTATEGVASSETSVDIGFSESATGTEIGYSLQLGGSGYGYNDFSWKEGPSEDSPGDINTDQFLYPTVQFSSTNTTVNEDAGAINIQVKLVNPDGNDIDVDVIFQQGNSTAEADDFTTGTSQTISFDSGAIDGQIENATVSLTNDADYEGVEKAEFQLKNISTLGNAEIAGQNHFELSIEDDEKPDVVINEFLPDPGGEDVDGNSNPSASNSDDEFIEILNYGNVSVNISGWELSDNGSNITHIFEDGTMLHPSQAIVVFSEDSDDPNPVGLFGGATVVVTNDGVLSLNNGADEPTLKDSFGNIIDQVSYSSSSSGISWVRDPSGTGSFVEHDEVAAANGNYSPGTKTDGSFFTKNIVIEGDTGWRMLSSPVEDMPISEILDDTPIQGFGDGYTRNFFTGYNGTSFTAPENLSGSLTSGNGFILYFYNNDQANSSTLPVIIDVGAGSEPTEDVTVSLHADGDGWNLIGNPFETAFDLTSITTTGGALSSTVGQTWSDSEESYITTTINGDKVAAGQGFFLQNMDAISINLPKSGKTTGTTFYKETSRKAYVQLALESESENNKDVQKDLSTMLYFHNEAKNGWDQWDAGKLHPLKSSYSILQIVSADESDIKTQDSRAFDTEEDVFYLNISSVNVKEKQTLKWESSSNIPNHWVFTFTDNKTGVSFTMDDEFSYSFEHKAYQTSEGEAQKRMAKNVSASPSSDPPRFTISVNKGQLTDNELHDSPLAFNLQQNYPNPFNPVTSIKYSIAYSVDVELTIYNVMGQKVTTLVDETKPAGTHSIHWNAANMSSGIYYYRLNAGSQTYTRQMTLIK